MKVKFVLFTLLFPLALSTPLGERDTNSIEARGAQNLETRGQPQTCTWNDKDPNCKNWDWDHCKCNDNDRKCDRDRDCKNWDWGQCKCNDNH